MFKLHDLMGGNTQHVGNSNCVLTRLWLWILIDSKITPTQWEFLLLKYLDKCQEVNGWSKKQVDNKKGNLPKALASQSLTFKSFCHGVSVLNYKKVVLFLEVTRNNETKPIQIVIPPTYDDHGGRYLKVLWTKLTQQWPEVIENWSTYMEAFKKRYRADYGTDPSGLNSSVTTSLNDDEVTWSTFYQGLMIHQPEKIHVGVRLYRADNTHLDVSIHLD